MVLNVWGEPCSITVNRLARNDTRFVWAADGTVTVGYEIGVTGIEDYCML